ncbi:MAG: hypothetical protein R2941_14685 [Desulfobacterales bacterium]
MVKIASTSDALGAMGSSYYFLEREAQKKLKTAIKKPDDNGRMQNQQSLCRPLGKGSMNNLEDCLCKKPEQYVKAMTCFSDSIARAKANTGMRNC